MIFPLFKYSYRGDARLVADLMAGNEAALRYLLYEHFVPLLKRNAQKAAGRKGVDYDDLVQELYLYLSADGWDKLRQYNPVQPFVKWFSVVSYRFFKDFSRSMIDSSQKVPISIVEDQSERTSNFGRTMAGTVLMDIRTALAKLSPPRDRDILQALLLDDEAPEEVAQRHNITVDNLYNVKRRAMAKLAQKLSAYK